jgi:two-component system, NtrC family, nitrogen regulation sensor histidine kinase GlnL
MIENPSQLLRAQNTALVQIKSDLTLEWMNPASEALMDTSLRRARDRLLVDVIGISDEILAAVARVKDGHESCTVRDAEIHLHSHPHSIRVDCTASRVSDRDLNDGLILEMWRVDRLAKLARDSWMQNHQSATRSMIRGLAHEIKNPLGGLRGAAQLLDRELATAELREFTRIITHEADRLSTLVDRMMAPWMPVNRETINLHEIFEHVYKLVQGEIQGRATIYRDYDPSLPDITVERDGLIQVFLNLVRNAAQAINENGIITLRSRVARQVSISGRLHRQALLLHVEDNGPGVNEELGDKIFFPLITGRAEGTGLGLSLAQEIVERHSGSIDYQRVGRLTRFVVTLPVECNDD